MKIFPLFKLNHIFLVDSYFHLIFECHRYLHPAKLNQVDP
jgi:hypothetical protein